MTASDARKSGSAWSREEVEATVASYFTMLEAGLRGEQVIKAEHRRGLLAVLHDRSPGAIERKHQNISAILIEVGVPYISGYKPLGNYQGLLREVVLDQLHLRRTTQALIEQAAQRVPTTVRSADLLEAWVDPPAPRPGVGGGVSQPGIAPPGRLVDYVSIEARNRMLGRAGEEFVIDFERNRLIAARQERLADRIVHVAVTEGDGAGYDVLSYEEDGKERLIEVKTTKFGEYTPFYVSRK